MRIVKMAALASLAATSGCGRSTEVRVIPAERDGGQVTVRNSEGREIIEITSTKGIGAATVPLARAAKPPRFTFQLRALEQLRLSYDDVQITVVVKASGEVHQQLVKGGAPERVLAAGDPYWMPVAIERETAGDRTAPIARIHLDGPGTFPEAAPESCRIDWVDFFR
jgi:hypothetical protein